MKDYRPLDLSRHANCGTEVFQNHRPPIGKQTFHGLPFLIGKAEAKDDIYVGFGPRVKKAPPETPIQIPLRRQAHNLVLLHTLIETGQCAGEPVGRTVATYVFRLADGSEYHVPVRERFEVGWFPLGWGHYPFCALPDQKDWKFDRHEGPWQDAGRRLTEADQGWPQGYYLWNWPNPKPDVRIESLTIRPTAASFIVAGITTGHLAEHPFNRDAAQEVIISLTRKKDADAPFDLEVAIDRGQATYVYPLPKSSMKEFLADAFKGWGEAQNPHSSPAYCEICGIDSATVVVRQAGKVIGKANWGQLKKAGELKASPRVRLEVVGGGKNWVHTKVLDADTKKPIPCRIHFRSPQGIPYAPHGHHAHVNGNLGSWHYDVGGDARLGQITYAYIDGACQGWLPRGEVIVDVARGYEYEPLRQVVEIQPGQRELTLNLKRWVDMRRERYFSGDTHVHFLSTQGSHLEGAAEDLNVVNLLQSQWGGLFTNTEEFTGRPSVSTDGRNIVYVSQENRQHMLGHLSLLGLKKPVMPWCTGGPAEAELGGSLEATLSHWADECHAQGGTVIIPHIPVPNCETAVLVATGRADAAEMLQHSPFHHTEYYRYLNCGYRLPLVGGTDKMTADVPVGIYRTYCHIPADEPFNYDTWCKALRAGNTFLSGGPMIRLAVEGRPIGSTLRIHGSGGTVEVESQAESVLPIHTLQIVQEGRVVASTDEPAGARRLHLKTRLNVTGPTWLAARCGGPNYTAIPHHDGWRRGVMAHTSPVYITAGGEYDLLNPDDAQYMLTLVEGGLTYLRQLAPYRSRTHTTHHHGQDDHQRYLEEPYLQARELIHRRMHQLGIPH